MQYNILFFFPTNTSCRFQKRNYHRKYWCMITMLIRFNGNKLQAILTDNILLELMNFFNTGLDVSIPISQENSVTSLFHLCSPFTLHILLFEKDHTTFFPSMSLYASIFSSACISIHFSWTKYLEALLFECHSIAVIVYFTTL